MYKKYTYKYYMCDFCMKFEFSKILALLFVMC